MSNLLEKASIVTTPAAYDNGKILSVKPSVVLGEELITNGDFNTDVLGWTGASGGVLSWVSGKMKVLAADGASFAVGGQAITTVIGKEYKATVSVTQGDDTFFRIWVGTSLTNNSMYASGASSSFGKKEFTFIATSTTSYINLLTQDGNKFTYFDNVSVKEALDGDFNFTRNSSATRVNSEGLIEDVQILSSNLVSNGDFSQEGSEQITNGDFATDSGWNKQTSNWTIVNGYAVCDGLQTSNSSLFQDVAVVNGKSYRIDFTITDSVNNLNLILGATTIGQYGSGTHSIYVTKDASTARIFFQATASNNFSGSIDNVSVKEVGQDWTLGTGWTIGDNKAERLVAASSSDLVQASLFPNLTSTFRISFDIEATAGSVRARLGQTNLNYVGQGTHTFYAIPSGNDQLKFQADSGFIGSITNISVVEITSDTNLPRIDYTDGVGSWLFEPQSTNLLDYSNDFSQSYWTKQSGVTATYNTTETLSPDGTYNATKFVGNGTTGVFKTSISVSGVVSRSFYLKSVTGTTTAVFKEPNTNVPSPITLTITNEWQRFEMIGDNGSSFQGLQIDDITSDGLFMWGAQLEVGSFPTSYIPTNGSTVTRLQDAAFGAGSSDLINSTEGVLYAEIAKFQDNNDNFILLSLNNSSDNSDNNTVTIGFDSDDDFFIRVEANSVAAFISNDQTSSKNVFYKVALSYKSGDSKIYINGNSITPNNGSLTNAFSFGSTLDNLSFDFNGNGVLPFFGKTKCVAVFKEALTDAELTCLTTI